MKTLILTAIFALYTQSLVALPQVVHCRSAMDNGSEFGTIKHDIFYIVQSPIEIFPLQYEVRYVSYSTPGGPVIDGDEPVSSEDPQIAPPVLEKDMTLHAIGSETDPDVIYFSIGGFLRLNLSLDFPGKDEVVLQIGSGPNIAQILAPCYRPQGGMGLIIGGEDLN